MSLTVPPQKHSVSPNAAVLYSLKKPSFQVHLADRRLGYTVTVQYSIAAFLKVREIMDENGGEAVFWFAVCVGGLLIS